MSFAFVTLETVIARNAGALYNFVAGHATMANLVAQAGSDPTALLNTVYANSVGNAPTEQVADVLIANLGIADDDAQAVAKEYVMSQLDPLPVGERGVAVNDILVLFSGLNGPRFIDTVAAWNDRVAQAVEYAATPGSSNSTFVDHDFGGGTFTLTLGIDVLSGTSEDDTFNAPLQLQDPTDATSSAQTLTAFDEIDGLAGADRLFADLLDNSANGVSIQNIEQFYLRSRADAAQLNLANTSGVEQLWNDRSIHDLSVVDVQAPVVVGMTQVGGGTWFEVVYDGVNVEEQTLVLDRVGTSNAAAELGIYAGDIKTLNVATSGGSYLELYGELDNVENLNISGSGVLELDGAGFEDLVTLGASEFTGDLDIDISESDVLESVITGAGDDRAVIAALNFSGDVDVLETVDLGGGVNSLALAESVSAGGDFDGDGVFDEAEISALDFTLADISGVAGLEFVDDVTIAAADATLDLDGLDDLISITFAGQVGLGGHTLTFDNAPAALALAFDAGIAGTGTLDLGDSETVVIDTADDFEAELLGESLSSLALNDVSDDGDSEIDITLTDTFDLASITLTGGAETEFTIDASGADFSGAVTINIGAFGIDNVGAATALSYIADTTGSLREIFKFVGDDIGDIEITDFLDSIGGNGDRLDFSAFEGVSELDDLNITWDGTDTEITSDAFDGTITVFNADLSTDADFFIF